MTGCISLHTRIYMILSGIFFMLCSLLHELSQFLLSDYICSTHTSQLYLMIIIHHLGFHVIWSSILEYEMHTNCSNVILCTLLHTDMGSIQFWNSNWPSIPILESELIILKQMELELRKYELELIFF